MASLIESQGYAPDELRSLLSWMLRDKTLVQDENHLFYWYYVLRAQTIKNAHLLLKSVLEDHAAAPTDLVRRVAAFLEEPQASRDPYTAMCLMSDISNCPIDRNLYRAYTLAMHDNGVTRLEILEDLEDRVEGEDGELAYFLKEFRRLLSQCSESGSVSEENARALCMNAIRVHQWCKQHNYPPLTEESRKLLEEIPELVTLSEESAMALLWMDLFDYIDRKDDLAEMKSRLNLVAHTSTLLSEKQWSSGKVMALLFGIYAIMDVGILPELPGRKSKEVFDRVSRSKEIRERLPMPAFAVDKNTYRGRKCVDTTEKFLNAFLKTSRFSSKEDISAKYHPIEASHGKSPHDAKQTQSHFSAMVEDSESRLSSAAIPKLFKLFDESDQEEEDDEVFDSAEWLRKLQSNDWRTAKRFALPEPFDDKITSILPKAKEQDSYLDFESGLSYSGPLSPKEALRALAISEIATKWAGLETVPGVNLRINTKGTKIFLQQQLIGERPALTGDAEASDEVGLQQRSLYPLGTKNTMKDLSGEAKLDMVKTFVFRRITGLICQPVKCFMEGPTGKIYMTDLHDSPKEHQRCQKTVRSGSAHWLFDSSRYRAAIEFVSDILECDKHIRVEVVKWLEEILDKSFKKSLIPEPLAPYAISLEDLQANVGAVVDAYHPTTTVEDSDDE